MFTQAEFLNAYPGATPADHKVMVQAAMSRGEMLSADILVDYPDLKTKKKRVKRIISSKPQGVIVTNESKVMTPVVEKTYSQIVAEDSARQSAIIAEEKRHFESDANSEERAPLTDGFSTVTEKTYSQIVSEDSARQNAIIDEEKRQRKIISDEENPPSLTQEIPDEEQILSKIEGEGDLLGNVQSVKAPGGSLDDFTVDELLRLHLSRSKQAQDIDNKYRSRNIVNNQGGYRNWVRNPGKYDVEGIDTPRQ
jgi:hypothetical protein